jgi:predicted RNase H-like nuclease (RuvC/YqgF family)
MSKTIQYYFDKTAYTYKHATAIAIEVEDLKVWQADLESAKIEVENEKREHNRWREQCKQEQYKNERLKADLEAARKKIAELKAKPKRVKPFPSPRYDAVYFDGIAAMDEADKEGPR